MSQQTLVRGRQLGGESSWARDAMHFQTSANTMEAAYLLVPLPPPLYSALIFRPSNGGSGRAELCAPHAGEEADQVVREMPDDKHKLVPHRERAE